MKKILLVDDSKFWRLLLYDLLKSNYEVYIADSGFDGIKKAFEYYPDIILTDYNMPDISGIFLSIVLRNYDEFKNSGIFILTSSDDKLNDFWVKKSGANKFFSKSIFKEKDKLDDFLITLKMKDFYSIKTNNHKISREKIYEIIEQKLKSEIFQKEILNLLKYVRDEKHLVFRLYSFFKDLFDVDSFFALLLSESEGRIYSFNGNVSKNHAKALLLSYFEKPTIPTTWTFIGDFNDNSSKKIKEHEKFLIKFENKEEGIILVEPRLSNFKSMTDLISTSLGVVFNTLNNFKEYINASIFDGLTELYNKKNLIIKIEEFVKKYSTDSTIAIIDIDNFKSVNDKYGHVVGDKVLKKLAEIIKNSIDKNAIAGRYGGEEFIILFNSPDVAFTTIEKIFDTIHKTDWGDILNDKRKITISCGVSSYKMNQTITDFIDSADKLLYKAKKDGKDRYYFENYNLMENKYIV
ncbi:diguanylate cyclase [Thermosipho sp. (in: thermotogales)]|uniref:GGDEF domain-containing response regulator n=1 Tax=Thermosipho sp. (in: thermotogales) TaxID=1968895 RepID=UPI002580C484|nr:diguanylate cyclase [Thermosipho sp. (in: thermotogales)]MBZ4650294.1 respons regulator [Thermosipho sp. (in: thermotogales)]